MEERRILITYDEAREWFNGDNESLKEIALKAFSERELTHNFRDIMTFKKACDALGYNYDDIVSKVKSIAFTADNCTEKSVLLSAVKASAATISNG